MRIPVYGEIHDKAKKVEIGYINPLLSSNWEHKMEISEF